MKSKAMNLKERIEAFSFLGEVLRDCLSNLEPAENYDLFSDPFSLSVRQTNQNKLAGNENTSIKKSYRDQLLFLINNQVVANPWFTPGNVRMALDSIASQLTEENLVKWTSAYPWLKNESGKKRIGVVMAGNIPLVGFHDFLSVLISGNQIIAKMSSKDSDLLKFISSVLCENFPGIKEDISFTEGMLIDFDAIIATGSGNSSRYFEYYFGKYPNIIRKNRNSVAIIEANETDIELERAGIDIFSYFGLGCRNISKVYVPANYNFDKLIQKWSRFENIINHNKYANNYDHNKAVYLVNRQKFLDMGIILLKEDSGISSPISVLHYEYYKDPLILSEQLDSLSERIQCITGHNHIQFGKAQSPDLWNYADGIDTIEFLGKIKN